MVGNHGGGGGGGVGGGIGGIGGEKDEVFTEETPVFVEELVPLSDRVIVECLEATGMAKRCVSATVREPGPPKEAV